MNNFAYLPGQNSYVLFYLVFRKSVRLAMTMSYCYLQAPKKHSSFILFNIVSDMQI